jgi:hypothetical protein
MVPHTDQLLPERVPTGCRSACAHSLHVGSVIDDSDAFGRVVEGLLPSRCGRGSDALATHIRTWTDLEDADGRQKDAKSMDAEV